MSARRQTASFAVRLVGFWGARVNTATAELILAAAEVDGYDKCVYSVGPYGIRVGFAFQQNRALNLVAALSAAGKLGDHVRIAVIGAGLAGITAKLALHGLGFAQAELIEMEDTAIKTQFGAGHRPIHPCYNTWPIGEHFGPTTRLPFLNWFAANARDVAAGLREEWDTDLRQHLNSIEYQVRLRGMRKPVRTAKGTEVTLRLQGRSAGGRWGNIEPRSYDLVILATGFGQERDLSRSVSKSYWSSDTVDRLREDEEEVIVSGTGDGGLMDFARLSFSTLDGRDLAVRLIGELRHGRYHRPRLPDAEDRLERSAIERKIVDIEAQAANMMPPAVGPGGPFGSDRDNEIAEFLAAGYRDALKLLNYRAQGWLDKAVVKLDRAQLVGRLVQPFTPVTAPINKLLVAYVLQRYPQRYQRGLIRKDGRKTLLCLPDGTRHDITDTTCIVRHGAAAPAYTFSSGYKRRTRGLHQKLANLVEVERSDIPFCQALPTVASADPSRPEFMKFRSELVRKFARQLGVKIRPGGARTAAGGQRWYEFDVDDAGRVPDQDVVEQFGGYPHDLFGVRLVGVPIEDADDGLARPDR